MDYIKRNQKGGENPICSRPITRCGDIIMSEVSDAVGRMDTAAAVKAAEGMDEDEAEAAVREAVFKAEKEYTTGRTTFPKLMGTVKAAYEVREALGIPRPDLGRAVIATLDVHTEGRNLMTLLLGIEGFETDIVEEGMMPDDIAARCRQEGVTACVVSGEFASIDTKMRAVDHELRKLGIRDRIIFCCGGQPVSEEGARRAGADVFDQNGAESVRKLRDAVLARKA